MKKITRIGIGGPVGSGKTAIVEAITPPLLEMGIKILIITNDVVTTEDAYARAEAAGLPDMAGFAPLAEILAAVHVKAHVRLFMN